MDDEPHVALFCGSRDWLNQSLIHEILQERLDRYGERLGIMHGDHREGADAITRGLCEAYGLPELRVPAKWARYGTPAGPKRNAWMLHFGRPHEVWAFRTSNASRGTNNMIRLALAAKLPTYIVAPDGGIGAIHVKPERAADER